MSHPARWVDTSGRARPRANKYCIYMARVYANVASLLTKHRRSDRDGLGAEDRAMHLLQRHRLLGPEGLVRRWRAEVVRLTWSAAGTVAASAPSAMFFSRESRSQRSGSCLWSLRAMSPMMQPAHAEPTPDTPRTACAARIRAICKSLPPRGGRNEGHARPATRPS